MSQSKTALPSFTSRILEEVKKFGPIPPGAIRPRPAVEESAVRTLLNGEITKAPPFLLAKLKKRLADFNAAQMTWRKS